MQRTNFPWPFRFQLAASLYQNRHGFSGSGLSLAYTGRSQAKVTIESVRAGVLSRVNGQSRIECILALDKDTGDRALSYARSSLSRLLRTLKVFSQMSARAVSRRFARRESANRLKVYGSFVRRILPPIALRTDPSIFRVSKRLVLASWPLAPPVPCLRDTCAYNKDLNPILLQCSSPR